MISARLHGSIAIYKKLQCIVNNPDSTRKSVVNAILLKSLCRYMAAHEPRGNLFY